MSFIHSHPNYIIVILLFLILLLFSLHRKTQPQKQQNTTSKKSGLNPQKNFATSVKQLLFQSQKHLNDLLPDLEEILLTADVGITTTEKLITKIKNNHELTSKEKVVDFLKTELINILTPASDFQMNINNKPYVIYLTGVNGSGKTTTIGKLACQFKNQGYQVMLIAADTFRAAAIEQLKIWAERNQVAFMGGIPGADPSSVIVDGLRSAKAKNMDIVLVDTAGRLQTKTNLMNELKKMVRMTEKELGKNPDQTFLVVDAITGQNGFSQAKIFLEAIPLTGVLLTKYDATAKGGIIVSIVAQTGLPIRYVGLGEGIDDLKKFKAADFVENLFK